MSEKSAQDRDKETLRRVMSEPTFEQVRKAMIVENKKRERGVVDMLRSSIRAALKEDRT